MSDGEMRLVVTADGRAVLRALKETKTALGQLAQLVALCVVETGSAELGQLVREHDALLSAALLELRDQVRRLDPASDSSRPSVLLSDGSEMEVDEVVRQVHDYVVQEVAVPDVQVVAESVAGFLGQVLRGER